MRVFHTDKTGGVYTYQDKDETLDYELDWTVWLDGDTIASASFSSQGVTLVNSYYSTTATQIWVKGAGGEVTTTITTASGRVKQETIAFREKVS